MDLMLCKEFYFSSGDYNVQKSRTGWVALMESRYKLYEIISNLDQYNVIHLFFIIFLSRALAAILAGRAESFGQFLEV